MDQNEISGLGELRDRVGKVEASLEENTAVTRRIEAKLSSFMAFLDNLEGAMKVMDVIGKAAKPIAWVSGCVSVMVGWLVWLKGGK
jgi:hypothetical protein